MSHCKACGKSNDALCACTCYDCDVVYFQRNLHQALKLPKDALRLNGENPFSYDEDFIIEKPRDD